MKKNKFLYIFSTALFLMAGCNTAGDKFDYGKKGLIITGTEVSPLVKFTVEDTPQTYVVTASATEKTDADIQLQFEVDTTLVAAYNQQHKTNYYPVPLSAIQLETKNAVIKAGQASSTGIPVKLISTEELQEGRTYIIPVTITSMTGGSFDLLPASKTIFLRLSRTLQFQSLNMSNGEFGATYKFPENLQTNLPNYTMEFKCNARAFFGLQRICSFSGQLLRFGESGLPANSLQWINGTGAIVSKTRFTEGVWYTISLTSDGSRMIMYVNGEKEGELAGNNSTFFDSIELGMSWNLYRYAQLYSGRIAEVRVWNRALSPGEIKLGLCNVSPSSKGLVAYWKFNEGKGYVFSDATGHGYDMNWTNSLDYNGSGLVPSHRQGQVRWIFDDKNKCSN